VGTIRLRLWKRGEGGQRADAQEETGRNHPTVHQQPPADAMDEHPSRPIPQTARFEVQQAVLPDPATDGEPAAS